MKHHRRAAATEAKRARPSGPWLAPTARAALFTHITKIAMWALIACGPAGLLMAASKPAPSPVRGGGDAVRDGTGPAGFAESYVAAYLRSGTGDSTLRSFYPGAPSLSGEPGRREAIRTVTTGAREVRPGYWSVTVAADVVVIRRTGERVAVGLHFFTVPVVALGDAAAGGPRPRGTPASYGAAALPAEVAAPAPAPAVELGYEAGNQITSGPLADTVVQFAAAYLAGTGDLARYLTPGTALRPITPAAYRRVEVERIVAAGDIPLAEARVPSDGTKVRVLATVIAIDADNERWPLAYALSLTARAGRWEVTALEHAPAIDTGPAATASTSTAPPAAPSTPPSPEFGSPPPSPPVAPVESSEPSPAPSPSSTNH
jgi:hypothetical protein